VGHFYRYLNKLLINIDKMTGGAMFWVILFTILSGHTGSYAHTVNLVYSVSGHLKSLFQIYVFLFHCFFRVV
jgi:hypothetical protein